MLWEDSSATAAAVVVPARDLLDKLSKTVMFSHFHENDIWGHLF
jgi:hypothetical protein